MATEKIKASGVSIGTMVGLVLATISGGTYVGSLSTTVVGIQTAMAQDDKREQQDLAADRETDKKLERIEGRQEAFSEDIDELKEDLDDQDKKLDEILDELRKK